MAVDLEILVQTEAGGILLISFTISSGEASIGIALPNHHNVSIIPNLKLGHAKGLNIENSNNNTVKGNEFTSYNLSIVAS